MPVHCRVTPSIVNLPVPIYSKHTNAKRPHGVTFLVQRNKTTAGPGLQCKSVKLDDATCCSPTLPVFAAIRHHSSLRKTKGEKNKRIVHMILSLGINPQATLRKGFVLLSP